MSPMLESLPELAMGEWQQEGAGGGRRSSAPLGEQARRKEHFDKHGTQTGRKASEPPKSHHLCPKRGAIK